MRFERPYELEDEDVVARLRALTDYWKAKHGIDSQWTGNGVRLKGRKMGVKYDARVTIGGGQVRADVEAGFLAEKLGAPAYVERKVADYLDPAQSLSSLRARIPG
ncbi:MAG: polyhydroxyalkanoic acid system family protein [Sandaracinaceae bacterium]